MHPENRSRKFYYLTQKGKELLPIMIEMAKWGAVYFPDLERIQGVYAKLRNNTSEKLHAQVLKKLSDWESENL